jgi:hypothetical protein
MAKNKGLKTSLTGEIDEAQKPPEKPGEDCRKGAM